jgi:hypothetical protein
MPDVNYKFPLTTIISTVLWQHPSYGTSLSGAAPIGGSILESMHPVVFFFGLFGTVAWYIQVQHDAAVHKPVYCGCREAGKPSNWS